MTGFWLKIIAMVTMVIDHTGLSLFGRSPTIYIAMRIIGRLSFPIFAFLIAEGCRHTHNIRKYFLRLIVFAFISEIPFDLMISGEPFYLKDQNVYFTLAIAVAAIACMQEIRKRLGKPANTDLPANALPAKDQTEAASPVRQNEMIPLQNTAGIETDNIALRASYLAVITAAGALAMLLKTDYGIIGVFMICSLFLCGDHKGIALAVITAFCILLAGISQVWIQVFGSLSGFLIFFYNGKRGYRLNKYVFYAFYPVHILILALIVKLTAG